MIWTVHYRQDEIIQMLDIFFIYNIFVQFVGLVFQQTIGIPMGTNVLRYSLICFYTLKKQSYIVKGFSRIKI